MSTLLIISGSTGSGKSSLAVEVALALSGDRLREITKGLYESVEIINADSVQVYKGFDIGAAKLSAAEQRGVPHHLLSCLLPSEECNAGIFAELAGQKITQLKNQNTLPLIVGGTGLYIRALLSGLVPVSEVSEEVRETIEEKISELEDSGLEDEALSTALHSWLGTIDPSSAQRLHPNDSQRIKRALEVRLSSGESLSSLGELHRSGVDSPPRYHALIEVLWPEREELYRHIDLRVGEMIRGGLVDEVKQLKEQYGSQHKPFTSIGYAHALKFLNGELTESEFVEKLKTDTRRFAKRQMTWWRNEPVKLGWTELEPEIASAPESSTEKIINRFSEFYRKFSVERPKTVYEYCVKNPPLSFTNS